MDGDPAVRIYVANGKPAGPCRSIPVVRIPEAIADRISYGVLIRAASEYRPSATARAKAATAGGRATRRQR